VAAQFPQAHLICAGKPANLQYYENVRAFHQELGAKDRIYLHSFRKDSSHLLAAADVFVLDSFFEGWSLAATEAVVMGTPLIHSDCGSGLELVGEAGERGVLIPNPAGDPLALDRELFFQMVYQKNQLNTPHLVQAMKRMIEECTEWQARRMTIRHQAIAEFGPESMLEKYAQVYRKTIAERSP
jgi:glycosyltransferase involved in cell wall biosynthesis